MKEQVTEMATSVLVSGSMKDRNAGRKIPVILIFFSFFTNQVGVHRVSLCQRRRVN